MSLRIFNIFRKGNDIGFSVILSLKHFINVQKRNDGCYVILNPRYEDERSLNKETLHCVQYDDQEIHVIGKEVLPVPFLRELNDLIYMRPFATLRVTPPKIISNAERSL